jgi:peroxisomal 2,4-dienoyl-CoA reductase
MQSKPTATWSDFRLCTPHPVFFLCSPGETPHPSVATCGLAQDVLVNNAAGNFLAVAEDLTPGGFRTVMEIDAQGVFNMTSAAFSALKNRQQSRPQASVINISAVLHYGATHYQLARKQPCVVCLFCCHLSLRFQNVRLSRFFLLFPSTQASAAKAAIDAMTRSFALEWGEFSIRVNAVAPGPVEGTAGLTKLAGHIPKEDLCAAVPVGHLMSKTDCANAVLFLASSEAARSVTGAILVVDGGQLSAGSEPASTLAL